MPISIIEAASLPLIFLVNAKMLPSVAVKQLTRVAVARQGYRSALVASGSSLRRPVASTGLNGSRSQLAQATSAFHSSTASRGWFSKDSSAPPAIETTPQVASSSSPASSHVSQVVDSATVAPSSTSDSIFAPFLQYFDGLVPYLHELPNYLGLSGSSYAYTLSIVLVTLTLRTALTLPLQLWTRRRVRRYEEQLTPVWDAISGQHGLPLTMMQKCRRQGKSYQSYTQELEAELKATRQSLIKQYKTSPIPPLVSNLLVSIPLFIAVSATIRLGVLAPSPLLMETVPWYSPDATLAQQFANSAAMLRDRGLDPESLARLSQPGGPTLGSKDPTMFGPLGLGLLFLTNVELSSWSRKRLMASQAVVSGEKKQAKALEKLQHDQRKRGQPISTTLGPNNVKAKAEEPPEPLASQVLSNILRILAIGFVPIASQAPVALIIYWLSTASYTFTQNIIFTIIDQQKAKKKLAIIATASTAAAASRSRSSEKKIADLEALLSSPPPTPRKGPPKPR